jgi:hypothetical protein
MPRFTKKQKEEDDSMQRYLYASFMFLLAVLVSVPCGAANVGEPALSEYRGKYVVLEWHNRYCPYTHKQYASGNMERLQKEWTARGVIWFTVISSAPGLQGYVTAADENAYVSQVNAAPTAVLLDPSGQLGHLYDARTTPDMYIINPQGVLIYQGAIDDKPTTDIEDIATAKNYVSLALEEAMAGKKVSIPVTRPYGCSVKYAN